MPRRFAYDVAVVGAGPAGSHTARLLAERGYSVALLERDPAPGAPVHCTGIVSKACVDEFSLPYSLVLHAVDSFVLRSPKGHGTEVKRQSVQGYILDREALDKHLASKAQSAGATLVTSAHVRSIAWQGDGVALSVNALGTSERLSARMAVMATGFGAPLARDLGLSSVQELMSGCQAVVATDIQSQVEVFTGGAMGPGGYGWLVPWKPGRALAGVLSRTHSVRYMHSLIGRLQEEGRIGAVHEVFRCRPIPLGISASSVSDGVLGVGDVVTQVKPTTGGGIYYGLLGAEAAAAAIDDALRLGDVTARGLQPYEATWRAMLEAEIRRGYLLRRVCEQLPDAVVEQLHRLLRLPILHRLLLSAAPSSFDWHSSSLLRVLSQLHQGVALDPSAMSPAPPSPHLA